VDADLGCPAACCILPVLGAILNLAGRNVDDQLAELQRVAGRLSRLVAIAVLLSGGSSTPPGLSYAIHETLF